eukprot:173056-Pyramimonas_sp.AAC.1
MKQLRTMGLQTSGRQRCLPFVRVSLCLPRRWSLAPCRCRARCASRSERTSLRMPWCPSMNRSGSTTTTPSSCPMPSWPSFASTQ